jgi:pimeloyl-ACP methyl ester carboxylesterase
MLSIALSPPLTNTVRRAYASESPNILVQYIMGFPVEAVDDPEALTHLSEIQVPTLVMVGEFDTADNHAYSGVIQVSIKNAEWQVVMHSGHLVYLEQPDKFNQLVIEFLNRQVNETPA